MEYLVSSIDFFLTPVIYGVIIALFIICIPKCVKWYKDIKSRHGLTGVGARVLILLFTFWFVGYIGMSLYNAASRVSLLVLYLTPIIIGAIITILFIFIPEFIKWYKDIKSSHGLTGVCERVLFSLFILWVAGHICIFIYNATLRVFPEPSHYYTTDDGLYHRKKCVWISEFNKSKYEYSSREEAEENGFRVCPYCLEK